MEGLHILQTRVVEVDQIEYFRFEFRSLGGCRDGEEQDSYEG